MTIILHITPRAAWERAQAEGHYRAGSLEYEGFVHCSTPDQVVRVANIVYKGVPGLVLLVIDPDKLAAPVKYEAPPSDSSEQFPHVYGRINLSAIVNVADFPCRPDGTFTLPADLYE